jgi:capsular exopolysaccharide synthesis family protein
MDAAPFLSLFRRWWWLCALGALMSVAAYGLVSAIPDPGAQDYRATVSLVVSDRAASGAAPTDVEITNRPWDIDRLVSTYAEIIESDAVAARAAMELGDESLAGDIRDNVSVATSGYTQILRITTSATTPEAAERVAGAIVWSATAIREERQIPGSLTLYEQAPATHASGNGTSPWLAMVVVAAAGALGAAAIVAGFEYTTDVVRGALDAERAASLHVLVTIPSQRAARLVVTSTAPEDAVAGERFRMLRTAFGIETGTDEPRTVAVVAPNGGGGATNVAANFALAVAQTGRRVALVDADLRTPALHEALGVTSDSGLADALASGLELDTTAMPAAPGVAFIAAGAPAPNASELLDSPRFDALVEQLREQFDLVVLDTPPALAFTDASIVASKCDAAIIALQAERSTRREAAACAELLRRSGARVVGIALSEEPGLFRLPGFGALRSRPRARAETASP